MDRCLPRSTAKALAWFGHEVIHIEDYYGKQDAQFVEDVQWIRDAAKNGWTVVTANPKIVGVAHEIGLIEELEVNVFCLANAQLNKDTKAMILGRHYLTMRRRWKKSGPTFWRLHAERIHKDLG